MKHSLIILLTSLMVVSNVAAAPAELSVQHRRPAAAALLDEGRELCVANRLSGSLSLVNLAQRIVLEKQVGQQLSDVVALPGDNHLLVADFAGGSVIVVEHSAGRLSVRDRVEVSAWPESIAVNELGSLAGVASLWSRRLTILACVPGNAGRSVAVRTLHQIDLPFAPRAVEFISSSQLVVADAFGGRFVVIDCSFGKVTASHKLPIHNIRDIMIGDDQRLYLTCQRLNPKGYTNSEDIHWGILIENEVLAIRLESLLHGDLLHSDHRQPLNVERIALGGPGEGAGDPEAVLVTPDQIVVTLAGTNELAIVERVGVRESRIPTGQRPVEIIHDEISNHVFVVNSLSDSVTVVDLTTNRVLDSISLGPSPAAGPFERGERAFFNAKLSLEGWMSCHSCHTDGHTNNGLADTLGDGNYGDAKRVPTLRGVWSTGPWAWNGSQHQLHGQIQKSLTATMHHRVPDAGLITDLTTYVSKLERVPSVVVARGDAMHPEAEYKSREVFEAVGCSACHDGFTSFTTAGTFDVGLQDRHGNSQFNPPSLSGVSQRDRLFHDGRAKSVEDVLTRFGHPSKNALTDSERKIVIDFLRAL
ncbi:MAG: YVTN family beta-propeller domain-containing protein [Rhodopirellula sp.]|nr:YVTN family beta-propeller domain-containing protein [Rhodopirellula sp.]